MNYFLTDGQGTWLNDKTDKAVWMIWVELRVHDAAEAIKTPVGYIPLYADLKKIFSEVLNKSYTEADYQAQFSLRVDPFLGKIDHILTIYKEKIQDSPEVLIQLLKAEKARL